MLKPAFAQKTYSSLSNPEATYPLSLSIAGTKINYYKSEVDAFTQIPVSDAFLRQRNVNGRLAAPKTQFIVTYANFTAEAKQAFQYAVDIWSTLITSSVPIRIQANWVSQEPNLLGSAGPTSYRYNFDGSQKARAFYPIALAEKIAHRQLNDSNEADIVADFNRNNTWYYGTDGKTIKGQTDLVTAVLHELTHGLGFIGFFNVDGEKGQYLAGLPSVYDCFVENYQQQRLVSDQKDFPNNSVDLKQQLTSYNLFLRGTIVQQTTGQKIRISAQTPFDRAVSIYHLYEETYPPGNINSLMTSQLNQAESIHTPGPLVQNFLSDLEWKTTSILHTPPRNTEDFKDFVFSARIISDTVLVNGPPQLFYRKTKSTPTDTSFTNVALTRVGATDDYQFTLPAVQALGDIWYYFQAQDASGRTFTSPGKLTAGEQSWHHIVVGPDNVAPTILYSPVKNVVFSTTTADSLPIYARIVDDRSGIDAAYVEYQLNGVAQPNLPLQYRLQTINTSTYDGLYTNRINFPANSLKEGDKITYRIVARDSSQAKNQTVNPSTGFYQLLVRNTLMPRDQYINTFTDATASADFAGNGFSVAAPFGFTDPAIHSEHPYQNGTDFQYHSSFDYVLLTPVRVKANPDSTMIRYDEIVLVEPAMEGSHFGDATFYDYVVVEGSKDNGHTWQPITEGYNSADRSDWQAAYTLNLVAGSATEQNSTTIGIPALYRHRDVPILKTDGAFRAGDQILIRFRLFADQLAHGWGWAIDNLRIQTPPAPLVLANEPLPTSRFGVYPNPVSRGTVRLEADLLKPFSNAYVSIAGPSGQTFRQITLKANGKKIDEQIDVSQLAAGLYFMHLTVDDAVLTQKLIISP